MNFTSLPAVASRNAPRLALLAVGYRLRQLTRLDTQTAAMVGRRGRTMVSIGRRLPLVPPYRRWARKPG